MNFFNPQRQKVLCRTKQKTKIFLSFSQLVKDFIFLFIMINKILKQHIYIQIYFASLFYIYIYIYIKYLTIL